MLVLRDVRGVDNDCGVIAAYLSNAVRTLYLDVIFLLSHLLNTLTSNRTLSPISKGWSLAVLL